AEANVRDITAGVEAITTYLGAGQRPPDVFYPDQRLYPQRPAPPAALQTAPLPHVLPGSATRLYHNPAAAPPARPAGAPPPPPALPAAPRPRRGAADRARPLRRTGLGHRLLRQRGVRRARRPGGRPRPGHAVDRPRERRPRAVHRHHAEGPGARREPRPREAR